MTLHARVRTTTALLGTLGFAALATLLGSAATPRFMSDDPIQVERDTQNAVAMTNYEPNLFVDFAYNVITAHRATTNVPARNVNTIGEVPDSSWFTNRAGSRSLTADEVAIGPDTTSGPAAGAWNVTSSKSDGVTPGFTIKDQTGQRWFLKFDPPGFRAMATGTEVTVTKLMWALGYNVPENHIAYMRRDQLVITDTAKFTPAGGVTRRMKQSDIDRLLERANREPDGSYRVVASKALEGKPIGRIAFLGTRSDDPNDLVPHEDRRELRGYGTFAAWLNHVDAKSINSLDMLVTRNGQSVVRHNLLDFGSALGSGGTGPADYWEGSQYLVSSDHMLSQMASFGFSHPRWRTTPFFESSSIGRLPLDNTGFDPEAWKPREPNRAFMQARPDDKFWAAQRLVGITRPIIEAAVAAGQFGDPESEAFLVRALTERRDAIVRTYLPAINPIASPVLSSDGVLSFRNAAVDADVAHIPAEYRARWFRFNNETDVASLIGETVGVTTELPLPVETTFATGSFLKVQLSADGARYPAWAVPVDAYFHHTGTDWQLVGVERVPAPSISTSTSH